MAIKISEAFHMFFVKEVRSKKYNFWLAMFRIPVIPKTKKATSTVNNIVFDLSLKRFCMHHVSNLKYVSKFECLSHKPSFLVLFACDSIWFAWLFVNIYLVALCCLVSVVPNILWLITFANFPNIETFHIKWWRQKFSAAIASVIIFVVINVHFTDQKYSSLFLKSVLTRVPIVNFHQLGPAGRNQKRRSHHGYLCESLRGFFNVY